jgi:tRNA-specific 2-thiouridylase
MFYTLGQRRGLGIGGRAGAGGEPWFVVDKDTEHNVLLVAQGVDHPSLYADRIAARDLHWVAGHPPTPPLDCSCKTRYRQVDQACRIYPATENHWEVLFAKPQRAMTPGQSVVFYRGDECLGGGVISRVQGLTETSRDSAA